MRKFLLTAILLFLGIRYGVTFLISEDFQKYGDREKAQWTCHVNNVLGGLCQIGSKYQRAFQFFDRVATRCPETPMAEKALFQKAACLESLGQPLQALAVYQEYTEKYPNGENFRLSHRAVDRIKLAR